MAQFHPMERARRRAALEHAAILAGSLVAYAALAWWLVSGAPQAVRLPLTAMMAAGGAVVGFAVHVVHTTGGTRFATEAERHSSRALRRLGDGWRVVDDVPFGGMNIDHVAIGRRGVVAVETTFLPPAAPVEEDGHDPLEHALRRARKGARRVRLLLKSVGIDAAVEPALAIWGRGTATVPFGAADGVAILSGRERRQWRDHLPDTGERLSEERVHEMEQALLRLAETRHAAGVIEDPFPA